MRARTRKQGVHRFSDLLRQRQDERPGSAAEGDEAVVQVEALRLFVLGVHDEGVDGHFGTAGTLHCIPQQGAAELPALVRERDGKTSERATGTVG